MSFPRTNHCYYSVKSVGVKFGRLFIDRIYIVGTYHLCEWLFEQILVVSCILQWPSGGAAASVREGLRLRAAPFRLPSEPTAGLLDVQLLINPVDQRSYSIISAWKSRDGTGGGGADNELVMSKWSLPDGVTTEWRSSERRLRRLQDEVIVQQLRDFLRTADHRSFIDKEDTIKVRSSFTIVISSSSCGW